MSPSKKFQRVGQVLSLPNLKSQKKIFVPRTPAGWELILSENLVGGVKTPWDPCSSREGVERSAPLPGDFRVIVGPTPPQMDDFCDLLGTPYPPVSRIATVKTLCMNPKKSFDMYHIWLAPRHILNVPTLIVT